MMEYIQPALTLSDVLKKLDDDARLLLGAINDLMVLVKDEQRRATHHELVQKRAAAIRDGIL